MQITFGFDYARNTAGEIVRDMPVAARVELTDLPALTGSDKQVAWAEAIRDAAIRDFVAPGLAHHFPNGEALRGAYAVEALAQLNTGIAPIAAKLAAVTAAKAWIEAAGGAKTRATVVALLQGA